jgi:hypothetical protein
VIDFTDPRMALEDSGPLVTGHRARHGGRQDDAPDVAATQRMAARGSHQADPENADVTTRSRRRGAWRKGTGVDEELWPAEEFGGVSDEQFWDDLAADRPLATTARTAQPDTAARRLPDASRIPDLPPGAGRLPDLPPGNPGRQAAGRGTGDGPETHPQPRLRPDDRMAAQPAVAAMPPSSGPVHPVRTGYQAPSGPSPAATGAQEDPLTSPAYALRPKGAVDGRSPQSSRRSMDANGGDTGRPRPETSWAAPLPSDRSWPGPSASGGTIASPAYRPVPADGNRGSTAYLYQQQPSGEPLHSSTPPYGERYGYPDPAGQAGRAGSPGDASGGWNPGQEGGHGDASRGPRPAYPPANGYRAPYEGGYDRR